MPDIDRDRLRSIKTFPSLVKYLRDELDWPIETSNFEDLTYEYEAEELGIDPRNAAKIQEIKQLRPLTSHQPWGIFFLKFEPKRLPVVALRRILGQLVVKQRASVRKADQPSWHLDDLLFISNYGEGEERQITFAHFSRDEEKQDLPTLKVLGWDNQDTALHLDDVADKLAANLTWPKDDSNIDSWRKTWRSAFILRHREVITTSRDLSIKLAELARTIRDRIKTALLIETERGRLKKLLKAFQEALVHDLDDDGFADMYAQTIAYGLLSARIANPKAVTSDHLPAQMPVTNPFLKELMEAFLQVGGRNGKVGGPGIDFDELGINEVVELLDDANMEAVVRDFGDKNPQEDPVIHFYELFLKEYDAKKRMQRGVFYTPRPVVSYIVRSVNELLRTEFGLEDGLADITTWGEMAKRHKDLKIPEGISPEQAFVQILDPATGTGTFLVEVIDAIYQTMKEKWEREAGGPLLADIQRRWNEYVPKHLLSRLHGYELLMAPYAIAHLKIGLKLYETGYLFDSDERVRIYLTNALEPAHDFSGRLEFAIPALAHESQGVNEVKRRQRFTAIIGNPPYAGHSANFGEWISRLVGDYYFVDGQALGERNPKWLQDDYVKFIRLAENLITDSGCGVQGYITNHGYIGNPTFRGMRQHLMRTFSTIAILDLHGSTKKVERSPAHDRDENVFEILPGVAIMLCNSQARNSQPANIFRADFWGERERKYKLLLETNASSTAWSEVKPVSPFYLFEPQDAVLREEYMKAWKITEAMPVNVLGFQTHRDEIAIAEDEQQLRIKVTEYLGEAPSKTDWIRYVRQCSYRPFDDRFVYLGTEVCDRPRSELLQHVAGHQNICLLLPRQQAKVGFRHCWVTNYTPNDCVISATSREANQVFPLWLYPSKNGLAFAGEIRANFSSTFVKLLAEALNLSGVPLCGLPKDLTAEDIFHYVYAVLHSQGYRSRYAEFLKIDFPRLPLPGYLNLFRDLARLGNKLVSLHLLDLPQLDRFITTYIGPNNPEVGRVGWSDNTVWLDAAATRKNQPASPGSIGFHGVCVEVWNFYVGGYRVCEKWLKDRKGRKLSADDIAHYQKIVVALSETIRLMKKIDEVIEEHGGWPEAFITDRGVLSGKSPSVESMPLERTKSYPDEESESFPQIEKVAELKADSKDVGSSSKNQEDEEKQRSIYETTREERIAAIRELFSASDKSDGMDRETAIREVSKLMGFDRLGPRIREFIEGDLLAAAHRGIISTEQGALRLESRTIDDYSRDSLKGFLLSAMGATWWDQEEAIRTAARYLGFRRTGSAIQEAFKSAINGAIRQGLIERNGNMLRATKS